MKTSFASRSRTSVAQLFIKGNKGSIWTYSLIFKNMVPEVNPSNRINSAALTHLGHSTGLPSPLCNCIARAFDRFRGGSRGDGCTHRSGRPASPAGKHIPWETCRNRAPHCNQPRIWLMGGGGKGERRRERDKDEEVEEGIK